MRGREYGPTISGMVEITLAFLVITPTDTKSVSVQPGRDLLTLFTCHPYGANYQRYLVICERDLEAERAYAEGDGDTRDQVAGATSPTSILMGDVMRLAEPCESPRLRFERALRVMGLVLLLAALLVTVRAILGALRHEERTKAEGHRGAALSFLGQMPSHIRW